MFPTNRYQRIDDGQHPSTPKHGCLQPNKLGLAEANTCCSHASVHLIPSCPMDTDLHVYCSNGPRRVPYQCPKRAAPRQQKVQQNAQLLTLWTLSVPLWTSYRCHCACCWYAKAASCFSSSCRALRACRSALARWVTCAAVWRAASCCCKSCRWYWAAQCRPSCMKQ